ARCSLSGRGARGAVREGACRDSSRVWIEHAAMEDCQRRSQCPRRRSGSRGEGRWKRVKDMPLVTITEVLEDEHPGRADFDFSVTSVVMDRFLSRPGNREALTAELRRHADACERGERPYKIVIP